eukprot:59434-Amphidinium_carterae.1
MRTSIEAKFYPRPMWAELLQVEQRTVFAVAHVKSAVVVAAALRSSFRCSPARSRLRTGRPTVRSG